MDNCSGVRIIHPDGIEHCPGNCDANTVDVLQDAGNRPTWLGTCTTLLGPGCQATIAICFWIFWMSGGFARSVLYVNVTTPSASSLSCFVQSCR